MDPLRDRGVCCRRGGQFLPLLQDPLSAPPRGRRAGERGLFRGCCAGLLLLVVAALARVLLIRLPSAPNLGAPPAGPDDGGSPGAIAAALGGEVDTELARPGAPGAD